MTDNEMMAIVTRNMQGAFDRHGLDSDRGHMRRFYAEVDKIAAPLATSEGALLREQAHRVLDIWLDAMQKALDDAPDPTLPSSDATSRRKGNSGYVGRTVIRAVVWNIVNSIFRAFR